MADKLTAIFEKYRMNPSDLAAMSNRWFTQQVTLLNQGRTNVNLLMRNREEMKASKLVPGSMYLFQYTALGAKTLPYYDMFPLVIPFSGDKTSFTGLNLHYLHPQLRAGLLDRLMGFATNDALDENTKLRFTWNMAAAAARNRHLTACVKKYLFTQVNSQFMKIKPTDWSGALMLPVESFVGASKQRVWKDSKKL